LKAVDELVLEGRLRMSIGRRRLNIMVSTLRDTTRTASVTARAGFRGHHRPCPLGCSWSVVGFAVGFELMGGILAQVAARPLIGMVALLAVATVVLVHAWRHH
jgi:hypothetical protein